MYGYEWVGGWLLQLEQAKAAGRNVVHVPLGQQARESFNVTAAIEFFEGVEGLEYGYQVGSIGSLTRPISSSSFTHLFLNMIRFCPLLLFQNMLWSWIDTSYRNYPCLPPDFNSKCLTWGALEPIFAIVDRWVRQSHMTCPIFIITAFKT